MSSETECSQFPKHHRFLCKPELKCATCRFCWRRRSAETAWAAWSWKTRQSLRPRQGKGEKKIRRDLFNWRIKVIIVELLTRLKVKTWLIIISGPPRSGAGSGRLARRFKASAPPAALVQTVCSASQTDLPGGRWGEECGGVSMMKSAVCRLVQSLREETRASVLSLPSPAQTCCLYLHLCNPINCSLCSHWLCQRGDRLGVGSSSSGSSSSVQEVSVLLQPSITLKPAMEKTSDPVVN